MDGSLELGQHSALLELPLGNEFLCLGYGQGREGELVYGAEIPVDTVHTGE